MTLPKTCIDTTNFNCFGILDELVSLYENGHHPIPRISGDSHEISPWWKIGLGVFYAVCVLFFGYGLGGVMGSLGNLFFFPLCFGCTYFFYKKWQKRISSNELSAQLLPFADIFRCHFHAFFSASMFALFVETILSFFVVLILGGSKHRIDPDTDEASVHVYTFLNAFLIAGCTEEIAKYIVLQHSLKLFFPFYHFLDGRHVKSYVWMGLCAGLGFGTMEACLYVCIYGAGSGIFGQIILLLIRLLLAVPFHTVTGIMWGIESAKRDCLKMDLSLFKMGFKQILWHGLYDFLEMEFSLFARGWYSLIGILLGYLVLFSAIYFVRLDEKELIAMSETRMSIVDMERNEMLVGGGNDYVAPPAQADSNPSVPVIDEGHGHSLGPAQASLE